MTDLLKRISRRTTRDHDPFNKTPPVVTLHPGDIISIRRSGARVGYAVRISSVYVQLAIWHADRERAARKAARKARKEGQQ